MTNSREHGGDSNFRTTLWSVVIAAGENDSRVSLDATTTLCETYWYPLYAYVRRNGYTKSDAEDLTQGFFAHLLAKGSVSRATPEKGKFRSFLLGSLKNYISVVHRKENAQKRGGGVAVISIDQEFGESRYRVEPEDSETPETLFERSWARTLLDQALLRLHAVYESSGRGKISKALEAYVTGDDEEKMTYSEKARELGTTESAITSAVSRLRDKYGQILREVVADTVLTEKDIEDEIDFLKSVIRR